VPLHCVFEARKLATRPAGGEVMEERFERYHPDMEAMHQGFRTGPCFVCRMVDGDVRFPENIIYEDDQAIVFLAGYPRAYGYTLVAPKEHREQVTGELPRPLARRSFASGCAL
jgi:galactose-1-phosphate uridylyltransferase